METTKIREIFSNPFALRNVVKLWKELEVQSIKHTKNVENLEIIRIMKMKSFAEEVARGYGIDTVKINYTTRLPENMLGFAEVSNNECTISINANYIKTENQWICCICHELHHIITNSHEHSITKILELLKKAAKHFNKRFDELKQEYYRLDKLAKRLGQKSSLTKSYYRGW